MRCKLPRSPDDLASASDIRKTIEAAAPTRRIRQVTIRRTISQTSRARSSLALNLQQPEPREFTVRA